MARLNWGKANKQDYVRKHGAVRAEVEQPGKSKKRSSGKTGETFKPSFTRPGGVRTIALDKHVDSAPGRVMRKRRAKRAAKAAAAKKRQRHNA
jgi:hypothetical protein